MSVTLEVYGFSTDIYTSEVNDDDLTVWFNSMSEEDRDDVDEFLFEMYEESLMDNGLEANSMVMRKKGSGGEIDVNIEKVGQDSEIESFSDCYVLEVVQIWKGVYGTCEIPSNIREFSPEKISLLVDESENRLLGVKYDGEDIEIDSGFRDMRGKGCEVSFQYYDSNGVPSLVDLNSKHIEFLSKKQSSIGPSEKYLKKIKDNGHFLKKVPKNVRNKELCLAAVQNDGSAIEFVPEDLKDKELCLAAVQNDGSTIEFVPEDLKDKELCLAAVQNDGTELLKVPEDLIDNELCLAAVKNNGIALAYVPKDLIDKELCLAAVQNNGIALVYVPDRYKDIDTCVVAVKQSGGAINLLPKNIEEEVMSLISS